MLTEHGSHETSMALIDQALLKLRRSGELLRVVHGLLVRTANLRLVGNLDRAAVDLQEARTIAEHGQMQLHLADVQLETARLALAAGQHRIAARAYGSAQGLVDETRYHRRDGEFEALARALGETPPDWLHQADIDVDIPIPNEMRGRRSKKRTRLKNPKRKR